MSISATTTAMVSLLDKEQAAIAKAQKRLKIITALLQGVNEKGPAPIAANDFGYCAQASLQFQNEPGLVPTLLKLYPPMDCVDIRGSSQSQKPVKYLRDEDKHEAIVPIYPVLVQTTGNESKARWWTVINGMDTEMTVRDVGPGDVQPWPAEAYYANAGHYASGSTAFFPRQLAEPVTRPAAMATWAAKWDEVGQQRDLTQMQRLFWTSVRKQLAARADASEVFEDGAVAALMALHDDVFARSTQRFQDTFPDSELVGYLATRARELASELPEAKQRQADDFAAVEKWFTHFFADKGRLNESDTEVSQRIVHKLRKDTGLDVNIRMMRAVRYGKVHVSPYFVNVDQYPDMAFAYIHDTWPIRPQDIEVDYVAL